MIQIGNVRLFQHRSRTDSEYEEKSDECPVPEKGIFFNQGLIVRPDNIWPDDRRMADYAKEEIDKLLRIGILNKEAAFLLHDASAWSKNRVECFVEFTDLKQALTLFEEAMKARLVDIYLYRDGKRIAWYD